jgi:hypothetical protein
MCLGIAFCVRNPEKCELKINNNNTRRTGEITIFTHRAKREYTKLQEVERRI